MDKIAANNHFVVLRKEIKKAKAMVSGNLIRKINKHKQDKEKVLDEEQVNKIDNKIEHILGQIKLLKTLDSYEIAKKATLNTDINHWNKVVSDSKAKSEDTLIARVIIKNNVQKQVAKFRDDYKDCDEWLNEYIEYRERKKELEASAKGSRWKYKPDKNKVGRKNNNKKADQSKKTKRKDQELNVKPKSIEKNFNKIARKPNHFRDTEVESLHPSWECKRREKELASRELLKAALSGQVKQSKKIILDNK